MDEDPRTLQYEKEFSQACIRINQAIQAWKPDPEESRPPVVVMEIDGTVLDNRFHKWTMKSRMPPQHAMLFVYSTILEKDIGIIFLTGRTESMEPTTKMNLREANFSNYRYIRYFPSEQFTDYNSDTIVRWKQSERATIAKANYIVACIGPAPGDVEGPPNGEHQFLLPESPELSTSDQCAIL